MKSIQKLASRNIRKLASRNIWKPASWNILKSKLATGTRSHQPALRPYIDDINRISRLQQSVTVDRPETPAEFFDADETLTKEEVAVTSQEQASQVPAPNQVEPASEYQINFPASKVNMAALTVEEVTNLLKTAALANKNIPKFDRKEVKTWLFQFEKATAGEDDDARIRRLAAALSGDDVEWFQSIEQNAANPLSFTEWKAKFQEKFTEPLPVLIGRLRDRKQLENEEPEKYAREIIRLSKKINPSISDAELIHNLTAGVLEKYRRDITVMKPQTSDEFIQNLKTLSISQQSSASTAALDAKMDKLVDVLTTHLAKPNAEPTLLNVDGAMAMGIHKPKCQICKQYGHEAMQCECLIGREHAEKLRNEGCQICKKPGHKADTCRQRPNRPASSIEPSAFRLQCQFCKRNGHEASDCYRIPSHPRNYNNARNNQYHQQQGRNQPYQRDARNNYNQQYPPLNARNNGFNNARNIGFNNARPQYPNGNGRQY